MTEPATQRVVAHHDSHAATRVERELRHRLEKARNDRDARVRVVEGLLECADLGINRHRLRALERAMHDLVQANQRHLRALAALGDLLVDGVRS